MLPYAAYIRFTRLTHVNATADEPFDFQQDTATAAFYDKPATASSTESLVPNDASPESERVRATIKSAKSLIKDFSRFRAAASLNLR